MKKHRNALLALALPCVLLLLVGGGIALATGTPAGTAIPNVALGDYTDSIGTSYPQVASPTCTVTVSQIGAVSVAPTTGTPSGSAGTTVYFPLTVTNGGNGADTYNLTLTDTKGWTCKVIRDDNGDGTRQSTETTVLTNSGSVAADASMKCFMAVTIPASATASTTDPVTLKCVSTVDVSATASAAVNVQVGTAASKPGFTMTPATGSNSDQPGATDYFPLTITNAGGATDTLEVAPYDQQGWACQVIRDDNGDGVHQATETTVMKSTGALAPGASTKCFLVVTIPSTAAAGVSDAATLYGNSNLDPSASVTSVMTLTVSAPRPKAGFSITPLTGSSTIQPGAVGYFPLTITNTGGGSDSLSLALSDQRGWSCQVVRDDNGDGVHQSTETTVLSNSGTLAAGAAMKCFLAVSVPSSATAGTADAVTVLGSSTLDPATSVSAVMTATAAQPANKVGFTMTPATGSNTDRAGATDSFPVTITNAGGATDTLELATYDQQGWTCQVIRDDNGDGVRQVTETTVMKSSGALAPGASTKCFLVVTIPSAATAGTSNAVTLYGNSDLDPSASVTSVMTLKVGAAPPPPPSAGVSLSPTTGASTDLPGVTSYFPVTLTNTGGASDVFSLAASDQKGWTCQVIRDDNGDGVHQATETTVLTSSGSLGANATLKCFVALTIPATGSGAAPSTATDAVAVKAVSAADSTVSATSTVTWTVQAPVPPPPSGFAPLWTVPVGKPVAGSPTIVNGVALIGCDDGNLYAVAATPNSGLTPGTVLWSLNTGAPVRSRPFVTLDSSGALSMIYITTNAGTAYGILPNGAIRWMTTVAAAGTVMEGTPIVSNGVLYVTGAGRVYGLDPNTGKVMYASSKMAGTVITTPAILPGKYLWVGTDLGYVYCLTPNLVGFRWTTSVRSPVKGTPVYVPGTVPQVVVGTTGGRVYCLNAERGNTNTNWGPGYRVVNGGVTSSPCLDARGWLYFGTTTHNVYCLGSANGLSANSAWPQLMSGSGEFRSSALVVPGLGGYPQLYIAGMDGQLHTCPADKPAADVVYANGAGFVSSPAVSGAGVDDVVVLGTQDGKILAFPVQ